MWLHRNTSEIKVETWVLDTSYTAMFFTPASARPLASRLAAFSVLPYMEA